MFQHLTNFQHLTRDIGRLFDLVSPSTLAALIHDIEELGNGAEPHALDIMRAARQALVDNCGEEDARRYLADSASASSKPAATVEQYADSAAAFHNQRAIETA